MPAGHIDPTKLANATANLEGGTVADPEVLQALLENMSQVIDDNADEFNSHANSTMHIGKNLYCRIRASANQTIPNATNTKLDLNTVVNDPYGMYDSTNKRIVVPETGVYLIVGIVSFAANSQGERQAIIMVNGTTVGRYRGAPNTGSGNPTQVGVSVVTSISAGGYVELFASQGSGGSLDVPNFGVEAPVLSVVRVA